MVMPKGYILMEEGEEDIVVGIRMSEFNKEAVPTIAHNGNIYRRDLMAPIPVDAVDLCSARIYKLVEPTPLKQINTAISEGKLPITQFVTRVQELAELCPEAKVQVKRGMLHFRTPEGLVWLDDFSKLTD